MNIFPFLHRTCTNTNMYKKDPFYGLGSLLFGYITSFWYTLLGGFVFIVFLQRWFVLGETICCMGESRDILV